MGRGRGKGRNSNGSSNHEDCVSGEEVKIPVQKKRGRPLKHLKEHVHKTNEVDKDNAGFVHKILSDDVLKNKTMKMKFESNEKEEHSKLVIEESADETKSSSLENEPLKTSRQNSRRRKNKPRRAAEAVVECC